MNGAIPRTQLTRTPLEADCRINWSTWKLSRKISIRPKVDVAPRWPPVQIIESFKSPMATHL